MKHYIVILREPDGRKDPHAPDEITVHRANWNRWLTEHQHSLRGGTALSLKGVVINGEGALQQIKAGPYQRHDDEIVGGYLLLEANDLEHATSIMRTCPAYEFGGFAEIREAMDV